VWEANHVWLILALVLLFTCFSPAFSRLAIVLHVPLTLMLFGIVLRGSAFVFRTYSPAQAWPPLPPPGEGREQVLAWGRIFAVASIVTPFLLGTVVGTIASSRVRGTLPASFWDGYMAPWLAPFPLGVGLLTVVLCAFLAAVYLTVEADEAELREDFRKRALAAGVALFVAAALTIVLAFRDAPLMKEGLVFSVRALPLHGLTAVAAITALASLWTRRYRLARIAAAAQVSFILWGWALAQYPYVVPPDLSIERTAAPSSTLELVLIALAAGALVLIPSLAYLFRIFKTTPERPGTGRASAKSA